MVEFAMAFSAFMMLLFGVLEFGNLLFVYGSVFSAVREAARYGASVGTNDAGIAHEKDCAGIRQAAVRIGGVAGVTDDAISIRYDHGPEDGRAWQNLPTCESNPQTDLGDRVIVQISVLYKPLIGFVPDILVQNSSAHTIVKSVQISGDFPTAIPVSDTATPTLAASNTATLAASPTLAPTDTHTATETFPVTLTPTPGSTATDTVTETPTSAFTPSATASMTPDPTALSCQDVGWANAVWNANTAQYSVNLINHSATEIVTIRGLFANWPGLGYLRTILLGGSQLWSGSAPSSFSAGESTWDGQANLVLEPLSAKPLLLAYQANTADPQLLITAQLGADPGNICVLQP